jgi:hypothetical protein
MGANPVFEHLTRSHRPPSLRAALWAAFGLGLLSLAFAMWSMLAQPPGFELVTIQMECGWGLTLLAPFVTAVLAGVLTSRAAHGEAFRMLRLTPLTPKRIAQGLIAVALFRVRVLLAVVVGLMPALIAGPFVMMLEISYFFGGYALASPGPGTSAQLYLLSWSLVMLAMVVGAWALNILGAAAGAWFGLRHRQPALAGAFAAGLVLLPLMLGLIWLMVLGPALIGLMVLGPALMVPFGSNWEALRFVFWVWVFFAVLPLLMARLMMGAAAQRCKTAPPVPAA